MSEGAPQEVLADVPAEEGGPVFAEPWQARIFAVVSRLCLDGSVPWDDFKARLIAEIGRGGADDTTDYYVHFVSACERLLTENGVLNVAELSALKAHLAAHPPHPTTSKPGPIAIDPVRPAS
jgi:nitrile hydratase accessory protein